MKLQELLMTQNVDLSRTKLIRHNVTNDIVKNNLEIYQSIQTETLFKNCDTVLSFIGTEGSTATFYGCYNVNGYAPINKIKLPKDIGFCDDDLEKCVLWNLQKIDIFNDLKDRLVIDWGKGAINWCQNGTTEKEVLCILPTISDIEFVGYDKIVLPYEKLNKIVVNNKHYKEWETRLSEVAGIYLITDTLTGKLYIGSASGENGGIWGRWSEYAKTKHGGNKKLIELINLDSDYCNNFQFSILEVFPIKHDKHDILAYEQLYKKKLQTIKFGFNDN